MHASWSEFLLSSTSEHALILDIHAYFKLDRDAFGQNRGIVKGISVYFEFKVGVGFLQAMHLVKVGGYAFMSILHVCSLIT